MRDSHLSQNECGEDQDKSGEVLRSLRVTSWSDLHHVGLDDVDRDIQLECEGDQNSQSNQNPEQVKEARNELLII